MNKPITSDEMKEFRANPEAGALQHKFPNRQQRRSWPKAPNNRRWTKGRIAGYIAKYADKAGNLAVPGNFLFIRQHVA